MKNIKHTIARLLRYWSRLLDPEYCLEDIPPIEPCINLRADKYDIARLQTSIDVKREDLKYISDRSIRTQLSKLMGEAMMNHEAIIVNQENQYDGSVRFVAEAFVGKKLL